MFRLETSQIIIILILLITKNMQIIAMDLRLKDKGYETKNLCKRDIVNNAEKQDEYYTTTINKNAMKESDYGVKQTPLKLQYENKDFEEKYAGESNQNFGFEYPNYDYDYPDLKTSEIPHSADAIKRREAYSNCAYTGTLQNTSLYPSVLTKALEISLNSSVPRNAAGSLFSNVAQKMNTSALDLAKILTKTENSDDVDQFSQMIENYKRTKGIFNPSGTTAINSSPTQNLFNNLQYKLPQGFKDNAQMADEHVKGSEASNLAAILDHVLEKLESIHKIKNDEDEEHPDGMPCDIIGSWSSTTLGFCFDMQFLKDKNRFIPPAEINNKFLSINVSECIPAKRHQVIDAEWKFTGSAIKQWGGPFHLYGQKRTESVVATFLGFCRTCNGIDTIFGSWNILSPTKDCHDVFLGNEIKHDILIRVRMEMKRKERFKDLLYQSRHGKL